MKLSSFGQQLCGESGIVSLMEDLGTALNVNPDMLFLGGGNPAAVPAFEQRIAAHIQRVADDPAQLHKLLGVYQSPQGNEEFLGLLATYLREQMGWPVTEANLAITNGSQSAFFLLFNLLAGKCDDGSVRQICLPMMPEYLGYRDQSLFDGMFRSFKPAIELIGEHRFKYRVDFKALTLDESVAALCVSRPTNPTGNVLTDAEMQHLDALSLEWGIPLIVDCAYGAPFPGIIYQAITSEWKANQIYVLSLSKLGLPGVRTGIVVAAEDVIEKLVRANTIVSLANGNLGPVLGAQLLKHDDLNHICQHELLPYYQQKRAQMLELLAEHLQGVDYRVHESEGAFFVWLWLPELTITAQELYQRLKARNVLVMAGEHFFFGIDEQWSHQRECLRLNFCQSRAVMDAALGVLAEELRDL